MTIFYPYPKTELYELCKELCKKDGFLTELAAYDYSTTSILSLPNISQSQLRFFAVYFTLLVRLYRILYKGDSQKIIDFIDNMLINKFFPHRVLGAFMVVFFIYLSTSISDLLEKFTKGKRHSSGLYREREG